VDHRARRLVTVAVLGTLVVAVIIAALTR